MKKVLGLDLGTTSIGWALVNQAENKNERSSIIRAGVRVNPLSSDEKDQFEKGKAITTNADRTLKRHMRRNLQRYKLRRDTLIEILKREGWISDDTVLSEEGSNSTFQTLALRSKAASSEVSLEELSRILLSINKKRGYKSSRKAANGEEGHLIDGMEVAKALYDNGFTPGQYAINLIRKGVKMIPEFYRSDLESEFESIWTFQKEFYPDILTDSFKESLLPQGRNGASKLFSSTYSIETADNKGKERKTTAYLWREEALKKELDKERLAYVLCDIRGDIANSSGYLGAISDRSKELFFNSCTVGEYLYGKLVGDHHFSTKNLVFYRQDYLDEFERIWETQKKYHPELNEDLKKEIRDVVIFYQRRLKSQKGLISYCEFEKKDIEVTIDGKTKVKTRGCKVAPRSSLLFQEFKIWQVLNNLEITNRFNGESRELSEEEKVALSQELQIRSKISSTEALKVLRIKAKDYELNYKDIEGNKTLYVLYQKFIDVVNQSGHGEYDLNKLCWDDAYHIISTIFSGLGFKTDFLLFNSSLPKEQYEQQPIFKLWHLLYSYEGDDSPTGDESLIEKIGIICNMPKEYASIIATARFQDDYASLSHKAIRKILPYLKDGNKYDLACLLAGYNHSNSLTAEERDTRPLVDRLEQIPKGALRNPVVEKILNQMVNVVNAVSDTYGKPDEIHIELARELKQSAKKREEAVRAIADNTRKNAEITRILQDEFHLPYVSKTDITRYRLYEELKDNGYKTLYSNKYIPRELLFSKSIDIEHIIPQALFFNDSYANKTLEYRDVNIEKGRSTARDYVLSKYGEKGYDEYKLRVDDLFAHNAISKSKRQFLLMSQQEIPEDFVLRDLTNSQYIAKEAKEMLESYVRFVMPTSGAITSELREQWQLVDIMKELNLPKYERVGRVSIKNRDEGQTLKQIDDWTKRNDHRHHAMDAITIAFTTPSHINILNHLKETSDKASEFYGRMRKFEPPIPVGEFRQECKKELESVLVSIKAKNKVVTRNVNKTKGAGGVINKTVTYTPRGSLHKEQVYGQRKRYETFLLPVNGKMSFSDIDCIVDSRIRNVVRERLEQFNGDSKKAFTGKNSLEKAPIIIPGTSRVVPQKVKCVRFNTVYSIRKEVGPDLSVDKVIDSHIRNILLERIKEYGGDQRKAFSNIDQNPIWLDEKNGISIKRVTIMENFDLAALRNKRDKTGAVIRDSQGNPSPSDFVNLRNNHHVAIYQDEKGEYQEYVVSFFEALQRKTLGLPVIDRLYNKDLGWSFVMSLKINEMFVFPNASTGFMPDEIDLTDSTNYTEISKNLFRVQKLSSMYYVFRHHLETESSSTDLRMKDITWKRITAIYNLRGVVKVRINHIGQIISVGDYD